MRIAVWHNLSSGGGKRALYSHVKGLCERGHYVEAWCPTTADVGYLPLNKYIKENIVPLDWKVKNINNFLGKILSWKDNYTNIEALEKHCKLCSEQINKNNFDILFANSCIFTRTGPIGKYINIPKVLYLQEPNRKLYEALPLFPFKDIEPTVLSRFSFVYFLKKIEQNIKIKYYRKLITNEYTNAKAYDKILVNSFFSRESVLRAYGLNPSVCYLGIDSDQFKPLNCKKDNAVIMIGSGTHEKNLRFIIEALALISKSKRPVLTWVTNISLPGFVDEIKIYANQKKVEINVYEKISENELVRLINRSLALVYAPRLEPFGYAPLEANSCGVPVVAVAEGGVRETIINNINGILVNSDPNDMARGITKILSNDKLRTRLGINGRKNVIKRWTLKSSIDRLENYFSEAINERVS